MCLRSSLAEFKVIYSEENKADPVPPTALPKIPERLPKLDKISMPSIQRSDRTKKPSRISDRRVSERM